MPPIQPHLTPSPSQSAAIEADAQSLLVLAGPGAGKTFCLTERIRFLIDRRGVAAARICAFTFTNKAASEISSRLERHLGARAHGVKCGTIHAYCAELLREFGTRAGLGPGFGIADEDYQCAVLRRLQVAGRWHRATLTRFTSHRFRKEPLHARDAATFVAYEQFLARHNVVDFDMLVLKAADLLWGVPEVAAEIRERWACVLVDEFQDLNHLQYAVIRELGRAHRNVFAVGDDEQSIYAWAGAEPKIFLDFMNDFDLQRGGIVYLRENRRCPREVFALGRRLVAFNPPILAEREHAEPNRDSPFPVATLSFPTDDEEAAWLVDDLRRDHDEHGFAWGDVAILYRAHKTGYPLETALVTAGVPCRLADGRALAEDPAVAYVIAALRVIASSPPGDELHQESFLAAVLPRPLFDEARAKAEEAREPLLDRLKRLATELPRDRADGRKIRRGFYALRNLAAFGCRHAAIVPLVEEILSQRVGSYRSALEEQYDELSDPEAHEDVVRLADRLFAARDAGRTLWIPRLGGAEIALKGMLHGAGLHAVLLGGRCPVDAEAIDPAATPSFGAALGLFKALQLLSSRTFTNAFRDFTAVDLETTGKDVDHAEIVEISAVRVRDGRPDARFRRYVRPRVPIEPEAQRVHHLSDAHVERASFFEEVWPRFSAFCGNDVLVAHNGYDFDFPILRRMAAVASDGAGFCTYDTLPLARELVPTSKRLADLARAFGIDPGRSHCALDDALTLARVFPALNEAKLARARKTALAHLLDHLGVALALADESSLGEEAQLLSRLARPYALGRYSDCLGNYRHERDLAGDASMPTVEQLIERLGGGELMERVRAEKGADERYPVAMARLRRLLTAAPCVDGAPLASQIADFLERTTLSSRADGVDPEPERVNLLTLHSTKGLEFSRVYVVGVEDAQLIGGSAARPASRIEIEEARRLLYVGVTRAKDRLVLTRVESRNGKPTGGHQFLDEMGLSALPGRTVLPAARRNASTAGGPDPVA